MIGHVIDYHSAKIIESKPMEEWMAMQFPRKPVLETPTGNIRFKFPLALVDDEKILSFFFVTESETQKPGAA